MLEPVWYYGAAAENVPAGGAEVLGEWDGAAEGAVEGVERFAGESWEMGLAVSFAFVRRARLNLEFGEFVS